MQQTHEQCAVLSTSLPPTDQNAVSSAHNLTFPARRKDGFHIRIDSANVSILRTVRRIEEAWKSVTSRMEI